MDVNVLTEKANQGDIEAQYNLGNYYYKLNNSYIALHSYISINSSNPPYPNYDNAILWYKKAAENGFLKAQLALSRIYDDGIHMIVREESYLTDFETVGIKADDIIECEEYYVTLVGQDYKQAVYWYIKAAEQGDIASLRRLCMYFEEGEIAEQDYKQAVYWHTKAAEQDNLNSQYQLGECYEYGKGVIQDYKQAVYWYRKAAGQGDGDSKYKLSVCYAEGKGVEQDYEQATQLLIQAAEQGNEKAYNMLPDDIKRKVDEVIDESLPF